MKKLRVLLTGGGSGGHIYPLIAVGQLLKKEAESFGVTSDVRYFGSAYAYAQEIIDSDIEFVPIISSKLRRYWSVLNFLDIFKFFLSLIQLLWKVFWFMPDVTFSKGGPGALAAVLVSRFYLVPVVIHESDSVPGLTNKISGRLAKKIYLAFASTSQYFKNQDVEVVGNPVRLELLNTEKDAAQAKKSFGFNPEEPVIFILGGSQGAETLNNFVLENLELLVKDFQILHQVGKDNYDNYKKEAEFLIKYWREEERNRYYFLDFFNKDILGDALLAADLAVSRAGAGTIFELAAFSKPAILVPLPDSANNHQIENARIYSEIGAALVIQQGNLFGNLVAEEIKKILANPGLLQNMQNSARSWYQPNAASIIAKHLLTYM